MPRMIATAQTGFGILLTARCSAPRKPLPSSRGRYSGVHRTAAWQPQIHFHPRPIGSTTERTHPAERPVPSLLPVEPIRRSVGHMQLGPRRFA